MVGPVCARHPGRETAVRCTRCDRPACPACLREASVGYQCVDCVAADARSRPRSSTVAWAVQAGSSLVIPVLIAINVAVFVITVVSAGFHEFGRRHQCHFMAGRLWDEILMECLGAEFTSPVLARVFVPDQPR